MKPTIFKVSLLAFIFFAPILQADFSEYQFRFSGPSFSNYGTIGIINAPTARFFEEGTLSFAWSHNQPYLRGSIVAYPFNWFEASYQYTDINNYLYSPFKEFSGGQSFKDKSFDAKFRIKRETEYLPAIAVGFRDLAGTGLFSSEFIVASKRYQNFDFTLGLGFGALSGGSRVSNPFTKINDRFLTRDLTSGEGGEFSIDAFFGGKAAIFGGIEYSLPFMHGSSLALELDPVDYSEEGPSKITTAESDWNFAFKYPVSDAFHLRLGVTRGNNLNFAFSFSGFYKDSKRSVQKNDPPKPVEYDKAVRIVAGESHRLAYRAALHYLRERNISMHSGEIKQNTMEISYTQQRYFEHSRAIGRVIGILDQVSPDYIDTFRITNVNAGFPTHTVEVPRSRYKLYKDQKLTTPLLADSKIYRDRNIDLDDPFRPEVTLPSYRTKISPTYRSQIGGPDGFFFGDLSLSAFIDILIKKNFNISSKVSVGLYNNYGELKLKSNSVLPHVRTDVSEYLKNTTDFYLSELQTNYFLNPSGNFYTKFSAGILEEFFAGFGFETLYRPFDKNWGVGVEAWRVQQRDYNLDFRLRDYKTTTGYINFYYREPNSKIFFVMTGGRFLAEDSGILVDISRQFDSGVNIGVFAAITDISKEEFGEGSFDKGFYFNMPVQLFFNKYSRGQTGFGLKPLTRDGAARLHHGHNLWAVTNGASIFNVKKDWNSFYD